MGGALLGGLTLLASLYATANKDLTGLRFIGAIVLAAGAIALLVEGISRIRSEQPGRLLCGLGAGLGLASLLLALVGGANADATGESGELRLDLQPTAPAIFKLAFDREIPLPGSEEGWEELRHRGGIDIGDSHFRLTLANDSPRPISVLAVWAEVLGSEPMPEGTVASQYTQGDEGIDRFLAFLPDGEKGSKAQLYAPGNPALEPEELEAETPFFERRYVKLVPGEVYPAALTVKSNTPRTIEYRLVAEGKSAGESFLVRSPPYRLVGTYEDPYQERFSRYYWREHDPHECTETPGNVWIDARVRRRSLICPYGPGRPYQERPPSASEYPPGNFQLSLQLARGRQSATISGVTVGEAPAAMPVPGMAKPLLRSLGTWDSCTVFWPSTDYWTARWEAWNLSLTFAGDKGVTDCTPRSPAGVVEIQIGEPPGRVDTELGQIELGSALVPVPIRRLAEPGEGSVYEREYVVPGSSPCDPSRPDSSRYQVELDRPGGILAWSEKPGVEAASSVTTTLPTYAC